LPTSKVRIGCGFALTLCSGTADAGSYGPRQFRTTIPSPPGGDRTSGTLSRRLCRTRGARSRTGGETVTTANTARAIAAQLEQPGLSLEALGDLFERELVDRQPPVIGREEQHHAIPDAAIASQGRVPRPQQLGRVAVGADQREASPESLSGHQRHHVVVPARAPRSEAACFRDGGARTLSRLSGGAPSGSLLA